MDPGLPDKYPLPSWWLQNAKNPLSDFQSTPNLPHETDILIIGAGYTGASTAYHLSKMIGKDCQVTVLDARGVAEGATGRNGGHLIPYNHRNILRDVELFGEDYALWRRDLEWANVQEIASFLYDEGIADIAEVQKGDNVMAYCTEESWEIAKQEVAFCKKHNREWGMCEVWEQQEARQRLRSPDVLGAIKIEAYQMFPAKWIWEVFQRLIKANAVQLYTQTPVTAVKSTPTGKWAVHTENKGIIVAKTIIHCTNGWMGHLLPELREVCFPVSEQVMALKMPKQIWKERGFVWHSVAHYLIQRDKDNIVIVGGGRSTIDGKNRPFIDHETMDFLGTGLGGMIRANDSSIYPVLHTDIRQFVRSHFPNEDWPEYEEAEWAGVQGYTKDHLPYIGPLEHAPNQFVSAGYNGHGMPLCWWSGRRVAEMVSGKCNAADDIANIFLPRQRFQLPSA
ncbi:hypothetical protein K450DRAFT_227193 [Umbelopsis ramanniana AG]|uniref:FAD dependent oxidoreductase domain-containing protein n=1 Tax=Umbelopsis ramanniana AG TaxID=1314678 RepID=A0AAD5HHR2_UMBRA|nr:uncharacterized protein K450DRAFT_227193 [Umbelopsis ramanniana AG]KAI8582438.1 hypothetical protein K450DRAFT_227193 [Umbelopsis ramanniana AG]